MAMQLNIGCGDAPTDGWINYDNSPAVWLARSPALTGLLRAVGLLDAGNVAFIDNCRRFGVRYANASHRIPHGSQINDCRYTRKILHQDSRRHKGDFLLAFALRARKSQSLNIFFLHKPAIFMS